MPNPARRRLLMTLSAIALALAGLACSFAPQELQAVLGAPASATGALMIQLLGAAYLGLAMLDWMARGVLIGGIYARPVAAGNLLHFFAGAAALAKAVTATPAPIPLWIAAGVYAGLALAFARVLLTHPLPAEPA